MTGQPTGRYTSPLRYPGGKAKVTNFVKLVLLENDLLGVDYVEPYAGGASIALSLVFEDYAEHAHINDINPGVHAFWAAALRETARLCRRIADTGVTIEEWHRQRAVHLDDDPDPFDLAFATFFLNRTNRSGIIGGGVIGGLDQTGPYKINARYNKSELIQRIRKVGRYANRITLTNLDAAVMLEQWAEPATRPAFLYLDPPYFVKGEGLYDNFYGASDHAQIATLVSRICHPWLVSYDAAPQIIDLYTDAPATYYSLGYSASAASRGSEVMFHSRGLTLPPEDPPGIQSSQVDEVRRSIFIG